MCNIRVLLTFICLLSNNFETLISCVKNVTRVCEDSWRSDEWIDMDVRLKFRKQFYCRNGALILPFVLCGKKYYKKGPQCVRSFHRRFRGNVTDPSLCKYVDSISILEQFGGLGMSSACQDIWDCRGRKDSILVFSCEIKE